MGIICTIYLKENAMQKRLYGLFLSLAFAFSVLCSPVTVAATETNSAAQEEPQEPTEMEINYEKPIDSNTIDGWPKGPKVYAKSAIVMDMDTGAILYAKNIDEALYPASITKIMTTMLAIENCSLEERVTFSDNAINSLPWDCSRIGARVGEVFSMEDCLYAMMLSSANEVCIAVAEHIAGSEAAFCDMMNEKAKSLGCTNTHFVNCNGMPDEEHKTSAHDMALIASAAFQNPTFRKVTGSVLYVIPATNQSGEKRYCSQHHKMMKENEQYYYPYAVGGKTGFTKAALNTLVTYATKDDRHLVCVSMRTNGAQYYLDTASLLDYGFDNFTNLTVSKNETAGKLLFPSQFFRLQPDNGKLSPCQVTVPDGVTAADLSLSGRINGDSMTRTYTWHDAVVGEVTLPVSTLFQEISDPDSVTTQAVREIPSLLKSSHAKSKVETVPEKETVNHPLLSRFSIRLTGWQLGLCGILIVAILLYIIILIRAVIRSVQRRKRRKRKAQRRAANKTGGTRTSKTTTDKNN